MNFAIPRLTRPVALTGYAPELVTDSGEPEVVWVWVNPPRALLTRHAEMMAAAAQRLAGDEAQIAASNQAMAEWYAEVWSQNVDPATHWTAEQVLALATLDTDPALYTWLTRQTWEKIGAHRSASRKN